MLPEKVSRRRKIYFVSIFPLLHRKFLCLLQPQWEEHCAAVSCVGCRDGRSMDLGRWLEEDRLVCLAGNFKWDRIRVETMGLVFPFYSLSFA